MLPQVLPQVLPQCRLISMPLGPGRWPSLEVVVSVAAVDGSARYV